MLRSFDHLFAIFGLFFMSEGFAGLLAPGDEGAMDAGSPAIRAIGIAVGGIATARLAMSLPALPPVLFRAWPALVPVAIALMSVLWSGDPDLALRRALALVLTTVFALYLAVRFGRREFVTCLAAALALYCVGSLIVILGWPRIGVHTAADTRFYEHIGAWRGLSAFKNDFGRVVAFAGLVFAVVAYARRPRSLVFPALFLLAAVLAAGSQSAQAISLLALGGGVLLYIAVLATFSPRVRAAMVVMSLPALTVLFLLRDSLSAAALEALGKNPTLTGRLEIWPAVLSALEGRILIGGGYGAGWATLVNDRMREILGRSIGHAHNGYLNLIVDVGIVGLAAALVVLLLLIRRAYISLGRDGASEFVLLSLVTIVFILAGNWVGSFLLKFNTIYWVLIVYLYCDPGHAGSRYRPLPDGARLRPLMPAVEGPRLWSSQFKQ